MRCVLLLTLLLAACGGDAPEAPATTNDGPPVVVTTFYPTEYLASRIGGEGIEVRCDVPDDADALFWMPGDKEILAYQQADLVILNGAGLETWIDKVSLPPSRLVDTSKPYADRLLHFETVTHSHGDSGEHSHEGIDPHTWLDPQLLIQQGAEVLNALTRALPGSAEEFRSNWKALEAELEAIDASYAALGEVPAGTRLYANHAAYNYMARRYGWEITSFDLDPETMPDGHDLEHLAEDVDSGARGFLLWESAPLPEIEARLQEELGLTSLVVAPAELLSDEEREAGVDLLGVLRSNHEALKIAFE